MRPQLERRKLAWPCWGHIRIEVADTWQPLRAGKLLVVLLLTPVVLLLLLGIDTIQLDCLQTSCDKLSVRRPLRDAPPALPTMRWELQAELPWSA